MRHSYLQCDGCQKTEVTEMATDWFVLAKHDGRPYPIGKEPVHMCPSCYVDFTTMRLQPTPCVHLFDPRTELKGGDAA